MNNQEEWRKPLLFFYTGNALRPQSPAKSLPLEIACENGIYGEGDGLGQNAYRPNSRSSPVDAIKYANSRGRVTPTLRSH